eukprot:TRINITY_DN4259_c0_g1_i1.p2 TRINITY_DN4259_c0_g1~~TRINITY_DN4259_c0_g1_i1.p2  ORF type:complete len:189 (-),score=45.63 TRINITY_DN4259_c0_g1_i1:409-975(-)
MPAYRLPPCSIHLASILPYLFSTALTQVPMLPCDDEERNDTDFPPGQVAEHNEQLDTRDSTTWTQSIEQIPLMEFMEVQTVNSTVPFMLISQLAPLLQLAARTPTTFVLTSPLLPCDENIASSISEKSEDLDKFKNSEESEANNTSEVEEDKIIKRVVKAAYVVNVTSAEGVFNMKKDGAHPQVTMNN